MTSDRETPPGVYLVATPIGNLEDVTLRALRVLRDADILACEDTRVTRKLFQRHEVPAPAKIYTCNDHNEKRVAAVLVEAAAAGAVVAYCSDAGMPGVSDPGYRIVEAARAAGVFCDIVPGPSAVVMAAALSGLASASFAFLGFPSRRDGRLGAQLAEYSRLPSALIYYESPRRIARLLAAARDAISPDRQAAVCLELTKKFQRVERGAVGEMAERFAGVEVKGEAVVVIAGSDRKKTPTPENLE